MGIFSFFRQSDINDGVKEYSRTAGAVLVDVRTPDEYSDWHIRGSINIPLQRISEAEAELPDKSAPIFIYCRSGARSGRAAAVLGGMGYKNVRNIGGIMSYRGEVVR